MPAQFDSDNTWRFNSASQTTAPNLCYAAINDSAVKYAMDFTVPMADADVLSSISSVTVGNLSGTEPTIANSAVSSDKKKATFDVTCTSATADTYTLTVTVVTVDGQTLVRKGRLVVN